MLHGSPWGLDLIVLISLLIDSLQKTALHKLHLKHLNFYSSVSFLVFDFFCSLDLMLPASLLIFALFACAVCVWKDGTLNRTYGFTQNIFSCH